MEPTLCGTVEIRSFVGNGDQRTLADDVFDGLTKPLKELPFKHLYDARGSELFDQITELPEYYQTRTERLILETYADDIVERTGAVELVEFGAGAASKTRVLLDAMMSAGQLERYVPIDVSATTVHAAADTLVREYPGLSVYGVVGDFELHLSELPESVGRRLVAFLGGTLDNMPPGTRRQFLRSARSVVGEDGHLLLGRDLAKDPRVIEAAYNDSRGITARFNLNVLNVVNRELDADFDIDDFEHVAYFDRERQWMEMRVRSTKRQQVRVGKLGIDVAFDAGEEMRTEISSKYSVERLAADLDAAGLELVELYTDPDRLFSLTLARLAAG